MAKNKSLFFLGMISAALLLAIFAVNCVIFYKLGTRLIDRVLAGSQEKREKHLMQFASKFNISFESPEDAGIFEAKESTAVISGNFASDGKHSLLVEFPSGAGYPGICFELSGKNCLNWSDMKELSFDVHNPVNRPAALTVKIKSGENYPKKDAQKTFTIPALQTITLSISREELRSLDLGKISYLNFFMNDPATTFQLNFDNIKLVKRNE